ncbi:Cytochrome P450 [Aspergillus sclerotialis]|uniref:Cytochrome P450 n=1 Tax=Aspergillus sclerotialis TaxID=2070753 RepID=A0A3A2ZNK0_9EURO|nr:Cytochrome P450 [Aspergillus sclerotialis]
MDNLTNINLPAQWRSVMALDEEFSAFTAFKFGVKLLIGQYILILLYKTFRGLWSPLSSIPGPWINKISDWPFFNTVIKGKCHYHLTELHKRYGPIVRLTPNTIAVADAREVRRILVTEDLAKDTQYYSNFRRDESRPTLVSFTNKKDYQARKRLISSMFGIRSIRGLQPMMQNCIDNLVDKLRKECANTENKVDGTVVDIYHFIHATAVDIIGETIFGQPFNILDTGSHPLLEHINIGLKITGILQFAPILRVIMRLPFFPKREPYIDAFTRDIIEKRRATLETEPRNDLLQKLVSCVKDSPASLFNTEDLQDEVVVFLLAGSETTANTEVFLLLLLVHHPDKLKKLQHEIDNLYADPSKPADAEDHISMRYLQACINEAMRLYPAMATGSPRCSDTATTILGHKIPAGTTIFSTSTSVQRDPQYWPEPDAFIPERWLEDGKLETHDLPFYPFSAGSRVCIGRHFAMQEMHLTLVALLRRFEIGLVEGQDESTAFRVALHLKGQKYMVKIRERK